MPGLDEYGVAHADALIAELDAAAEWPLPRERRAQTQTRIGRAFRRNDTAALRAIAGWPLDRPTYVPDALPRRIALGFADFLFSEEFELTLGENMDVKPYREVIDLNQLPARLHRAERMVVSEGEAWWKLHRNGAISAVPMISWCSRSQVVPFFYGDRVLAAGFVSEVGRQAGAGEDDPAIVWRHVELHAAGVVRNLLYRGEEDQLGRRVRLTDRPATAPFPEEWRHGLPILAGRITNDLDDDDTLGESEYTHVHDLLLGLNEAVTIGVENARLTGKDRVAVAGKLNRAPGGFDASLEVFEVEKEGETFGTEGSVPIFAIEKRYDAEPLWLHIDKLVRMVLSRVGLVAQIVGDDEGNAGSAESGVARRLRFLPTTNAARAKGRPWLVEIPQQLALMRAMPETGMPAMTGADLTPPTVALRDPLPRDESEAISDHATAVTAEIESRETAIRELHPEWTEEEVTEELDRIAGERPSLPTFDGGGDDDPPHVHEDE